MIGNIILLLISFLLIWKLKYPWDALGLKPGIRRVGFLLGGLLLASLIAAGYFSWTAHLADSSLLVNENYTWELFLSGLFWVFRGVLYEELIFRGVPLLILIRYLSVNRACLVSAVCFGIYHWFSYNIIGQPVEMGYVFLITGVAGYMFAYAFALSRTLYLPIGLHLGWNVVTILIYSQGPFGDQLIVPQAGETIGTIPSLMLFLYQLLVLPVLTIGVLKVWSKQLQPQV